RISYPHAYYHVTCRGNDRRAIFRDDRDRTLFLEKLRVSIEIYDVKLHAYVLMDNHFHFIAETPKANLSEFMRHFNIGYTGRVQSAASKGWPSLSRAIQGCVGGERQLLVGTQSLCSFESGADYAMEEAERTGAGQVFGTLSLE